MSDDSTFLPFTIARREDGSRHELGRGAMGITYKAIDTQLGRTVALKVINTSYLGDRIIRQRFLSEARSAAQLHHPNVAGVFQLRADDEHVFYAMEFVEGVTVESFIKKNGPLPPRLALRVIQQAAEGLAAAHDRGLIHRDIKPSNIMIARAPRPSAEPEEQDEDGLLVKVIDFGLAKSINAEGLSKGAALTGDGVVGTPHYMSPEQIAPESGTMIDERVDIYSLGATLWYLLAGRPPFEGAPFQVLSQHLHTKPPFEKLETRGVPPDVINLLGTMLAKDREDRFNDYPALLVAMRKLLRTGGTTYVRLPSNLGDSSSSDQTIMFDAAKAPSGSTSRVMLALRHGPKRKSLRWLILGAVVLVTGAGILVGRQWLLRRHGAVAPPVVDQPETESRQLVAKARDLLETQDDASRENISLADELCKRAVTIDPSDGEVWAASAQVSAQLVSLYYDRSPARYESLRTQAERAIKLAPESVEAGLAQALYFSRGSTATLADSERILRRLTSVVPNDRRVWRALSYTLRMQGRFDEAIDCLNRAIALPGGDPVSLLEKGSALLFAGRGDEAEVALDRSIAVKPLGRALLLKTFVALVWTGDLEKARAALERVPRRMLLEDRGAALASWVWLWRREPDKSLAALNVVPRDYFHDAFFTGPKAALAGMAQKMAGRADAARNEWRSVVRVTEQRLTTEPNDLVSVLQRAFAQAELGQGREAEQTSRTYRELGGSTGATSPLGGEPGLDVLLKRESEALDQIQQEINNPREFFITRAVLRLHPAFDGLRDDPRFQQLIEQAAGPAQKNGSGPGR